MNGRKRTVLGIMVLGLFILGAAPTTISWAGGLQTPCTDAGNFVFKVEVTNVSAESMTPTPFAPGVWTLHTEVDPLIRAGMPAAQGLEALAEDGNPAPLAGTLEASGVKHGVFHTPQGKDAPGPLLPGDSYVFLVETSTATPRLSLALMFVQSNDWFIGTGEQGIDMLNGSVGPRADGDVTDQLYLWDAGTELDETIGEGANQAPRQAGPNTGPADPDNTVRLVAGEMAPQASDLVQVTVTRILPTVFDVFIKNTSAALMYETPFAPGVFVAHTDSDEFYMEGHPQLFFEGRPALHNGLEALAEDGDPTQAWMSLATYGGMKMPQESPAVGIFDTPVGQQEPGPLLPGDQYAFTVTTDPFKPMLSLALMYVQSNDWFVATPARGIRLFGSDGSPLSGAVPVFLYDAGTEEDEELAQGMYQAPRQPAPNTGPADDDDTVRKVPDIDANELLEVTIVPRSQQAFRITVTNISEGEPIAPGVAVLHRTCEPLFSAGVSDRGMGLEALAEDGDPSVLAASLGAQGVSVQVVNQAVASNAPPGTEAAPGPLLPNTTYEFEVTADPAHPHLSLAFMYVLSNDLFVGTPAGGIALWDTQGQLRSGDITGLLSLWDAGTEHNQAPGVGTDQPLMQSGPDMGRSDPVDTVRSALPGYTLSPLGELISVSVTPIAMEETETE